MHVDPTEAHFITQAGYLVRNFNLNKAKADLLGTRLQNRNLLDHTKLVLSLSIILRQSSMYCSNLGGLMKDLRRKHKLDEWRLFIDALSSHGIFRSPKGSL